MTDYEIYALQSYNDHVIEDKRPTKNSNIEDLNLQSINNYIEKIKIDKPNFAKNSIEKSLKLCGIIDSVGQKIVPTLAGTLIFGDYPQLFIACAVIPRTTIGEVGNLRERFIDNKRGEGTIEEMI